MWTMVSESQPHGWPPTPLTRKFSAAERVSSLKRGKGVFTYLKHPWIRLSILTLLFLKLSFLDQRKHWMDIIYILILKNEFTDYEIILSDKRQYIWHSFKALVKLKFKKKKQVCKNIWIFISSLWYLILNKL